MTKRPAADLHVRLTEKERETLERYAEQEDMRISDVIRALIRGLRRKVER